MCSFTESTHHKRLDYVPFLRAGLTPWLLFLRLLLRFFCAVFTPKVRNTALHISISMRRPNTYLFNSVFLGYADPHVLPASYRVDEISFTSRHLWNPIKCKCCIEFSLSVRSNSVKIPGKPSDSPAYYSRPTVLDRTTSTSLQSPSPTIQISAPMCPFRGMA